MYTQNSNRAWKRNLAQVNTCNRAARRNASRILASLQPTGAVPTDTVPSVATVQRVYTRPYVGVNSEGFRVMVRSAQTPESLTGVIGPFKTARAAQFSVNNPVLSVAECERVSKV